MAVMGVRMLMMMIDWGVWGSGWMLHHQREGGAATLVQFESQ